MKKLFFIILLCPVFCFGQRVPTQEMIDSANARMKTALGVEGDWKDSTRQNLYQALANRPTLSRVQDSLQAVRATINTKSTIFFGLDAGANDSYVITATPSVAAYTQGMVVMFRANTQNTTGCTINVSGLGAKTIVKRVSTTPATGDILSQMFCWLIYDGTNFVLLNPVVN